MLPAVPTSKWNEPAFTLPGLKINSVEPIFRPLEEAPQIWANALAPVRCWAFNPGSALPALMLKIRTSRLNTADRAREVRRTCPPRSEEHTSELQSRFDLVCRLLLEKKK